MSNKLEPEWFWDEVFDWSNYSKGATYSVSDILAEPLMVKLRLAYPKERSVKAEDKKASWVGSAIHAQVERIMAEYENVESEVAVKFKNLSGTIDLVIDGKVVADVKTGAEDNIRTKILDVEKGRDSSFKKQLSLYRYLYWKTFGIWLNDVGLIYWYCTDSKKNGVLSVELLTKEETISLIKSFMVEMKIPIEDTAKCKLCTQFLYRWCEPRLKCPSWTEERDSPNVECW